MLYYIILYYIALYHIIFYDLYLYKNIYICTDAFYHLFSAKAMSCRCLTLLKRCTNCMAMLGCMDGSAWGKHSMENPWENPRNMIWIYLVFHSLVGLDQRGFVAGSLSTKNDVYHTNRM